MEPGVEPAWALGRIGKRGRDEQAIGLNRAVDFRDVAANDKAGRVGPGWFSGGKFVRALMAVREEFFCGANVVGTVEEFIVTQRIIHGVKENLHIGNEVDRVGIRLERREFCAEFFYPAFKFGAVRIRDGEAGRRNRADFVGNVIARAISAHDGDGADEKKQSENHAGRMKEDGGGSNGFTSHRASVIHGSQKVFVP